MNKIIILGISLILFLTACGNDSTYSTYNKETVQFVDGEDLSIAEKYAPKVEPPTLDTAEVKISVKTFLGKRPEPFTNEELPKSYVDRKFFKGLVNSTYDIFLVPGYIVKFNPTTGDYQKKTLTPIIKNGKKPVTDVITEDNGLIYSNKINKSASFSASAVIGGLSVGNKQMMELIIQDVSKSTVPDTLIDEELIASIIKNQIPVAEKQNYFYVKSATLTLINNKIFKETSFEAKVNSTYVTAEGKVFSSNEKFSRNRIVSVELISLEDLLSIRTKTVIP